MMLGGRNAEDLVFGVVSSGAGDDLQKATQLARRMVSEWGMSDEIGPMAFGGGGPVFLGDEMMQSREYSDKLAHKIDTETQRVLLSQEDRCRDLLTTNRKALNLVARGLLEHETLSGDEVNRLIEVAESGDGDSGQGADGNGGGVFGDDLTEGDDLSTSSSSTPTTPH